MSTETPYNPYAAFENMADEDVVLKAKQEDNALAQEYLLHKYRNFVRAKARSYFLIGAEREDIIQEGMIGLYKAIRDFRGEVPGSSAKDCGNYLDMNLPMANWLAKKYLEEVLTNITEERLVYPQ